MDKKTAEALVKALVKAEYGRYKAYVDAYKESMATDPARDWIKIRLTMDEAAAFLGE